MMNSPKYLNYKERNVHTGKIVDTLSKYKDKSNEVEISTDYFLDNNIWSSDFFVKIGLGNKPTAIHLNKNMVFGFHNENLNLEIKFLVYTKMSIGDWNLTNAFNNISSKLKRLADFMNEHYPNVDSIVHLDIDKAKLKWINYLIENDIEINAKKTLYETGEQYEAKSNTTGLISRFKREIGRLLYRDIGSFEEDIWYPKELVRYNIKYNPTRNGENLNFTKINNPIFKEVLKRYLKKRLINEKLAWSTALGSLRNIRYFLNFINKEQSDWKDLKKLKREHIEYYIEHLNFEASSPKSNIKNKSGFIRENLKFLSKFISDLQLQENEFGPTVNVKSLIMKCDKPNISKKSLDSISYIPDTVLEQVFDNIDELHHEVSPVLWVMYKTGLRVSDALRLKQDCLIRIGNKFWIESDIEKTYVEGHRIPIDDELANIIAVLIDQSLKYSNKDNNPNNYIFVRFEGKRKGMPYDQRWISTQLNVFARKCSITDESGKIYRLKNHSFRHTYAVKMLNGGADILTIQELLAHASPEMTMRYAKLLDDTKRKVFDKVIKQGVFSFDNGDKLKEESDGEIPSDILDMLYMNHKLNAIDTPYGTCLQRTNGKCGFAKQPPCLTCNGGNPCKDLCVGAFEGDIQKYEILINSTKSMIENAKMYSRNEMAKENEELLQLYEDIYTKISQGNMIYSRLDKLKRKDGKNE